MTAIDSGASTINVTSAGLNRPNVITVTVRGPSGVSPPQGLLLVNVSLSGPASGLATVLVATETAPGQFQASFIPLVEGNWIVNATIQFVTGNGTTVVLGPATVQVRPAVFGTICCGWLGAF